MIKIILGVIAAVVATIIAAQLAYNANPNTRSQPGMGAKSNGVCRLEQRKVDNLDYCEQI